MVYCWAHARRKLKEVFGHNGSEIAAEGLHRIAEFYAVKADIRGVSPGQRLSARQARTAPLYVPLVARLDLGIDMQMVWFGILYTMTSQIAYITPPFGYNLFLMRGLAPKEITLIDIYCSIWPFVIMIIFTIILLMIFPQIATWLPMWMRG